MVSKHGINGTVGGDMSALKKYVKTTKKYPGFKKIDFKWSGGTGDDFPRLNVRVKDELVAFGSPAEIDVDINYFRNPFPSYLRHFLYYFDYEGQNDFIFPLADRAWKDGIFKNFSLNPSLYRTQIFKNCKFQRDLEFELKFGQQNNFKQIYTKWPRFFHIGTKESLGTGKN